ncbi:type II secretion system F family protein [Nevskia sp.]|uniref:type II secretion system F family protein n=1 Tax=Nevskia sp. TaxID=1929292 RepID=UPI0025FDE8DE|nr:type II secretion system F family protein [Nevskia sp.]
MTPTIYALVITGAILFGVATLGALILLVLDARGARRLRQRLGLLGENAEDFEGADHKQLLEGFARQGQSLEKLVDKEGETPRLLAQAGWRGPESRLWFYALQGLVPIVLGFGVFAGIGFGGKLFQPPTLFLLIFAAFALSILLPRWILRSAANSRRMRIRNEVPLFLHLLVLLFEAGLSTRQALGSIVREGRGVLPELGREFDSCVRQFDAGADTSAVLRQLGDVMEVDDLSSVLGVLRQVDRYGGEVREPLLDMMKLIEERRGMDLRERVNIISGRMTVVMVLFFFPALLIFVAGPAALSIMSTLGAAAGSSTQ